jgi:hypothetical protein
MARQLPGLKRIGPNVWWWGCWEIQRYANEYAPFWIATDIVSQMDGWTAYERTRTCGDSLADLRWFVADLAHLSPDPLPAQEAV